MQAFEPVSNNLFHPPQNAVFTEICEVSKTAINVIKTLGIILMAAGASCFIASLQIPAIALLVAGTTALILGLTLKESTTIREETSIYHLFEDMHDLTQVFSEDETTKIKEFIHFFKDHRGSKMEIDFNGKLYQGGKTERGFEYIDDRYGKTGIFLSKDDILTLYGENAESVYRSLVTYSYQLIMDLGIDNRLEAINQLRAHCNPEEQQAFAVFHRALLQFSLNGNLATAIPVDLDHFHEPQVFTTIREVFRAAVDLQQEDGIQQMLNTIEELPEDSVQALKRLAAGIKLVLPIVQLILQRYEE